MASKRNSWSVQAAKAKLSEILRRARAGEPQMIGTDDPCVVVSEQAWRRAARNGDDFGRWLVKTAPRGTPLQLPRRTGTRRGDPFADADR
ncbi:MAG: type II toxin-antitoxin system prevent-host-death family antitoxin [Dongiaceae bacterium]